MVLTTADAVDTPLLRALASHSSELLVLVRPDGITQGELTLGAVPLGYPPEQRYASRHVGEHVHPDDLPEVLALLEEVRSHPGTNAHLRVRARHFEGHWCLLDVDIIDRSSDPLLCGVVLRARLASTGGDGSSAGGLPGAAAEDDRFRSLAEVIPSGILSADRRGHVVYVNHEASRIMGLPPELLYGQGWEAVVAAEDRPDVAAATGAVLSGSDRERLTFRAHVRGETRWMSAAFVPLGGPTASSGWIGTIDDVTDRRKAEIRLAHQATHDSLTGLPNRMLLADRLGQAIARLEREPNPLAVLYVDLDGFKPVNDRHGHAVGDQVLVEMARRLRLVIRHSDTVARVGGDEFVVVCEHVDRHGAVDLAGRIGELLREPLLLAGSTVSVGASIGAVVTTTADTDPETLIAAADREMYRVKQGGGGSLSLSG